MTSGAAHLKRHREAAIRRYKKKRLPQNTKTENVDDIHQ
jgi:hypothetical protein